MLTYGEALDYLYSFVDYSGVRADRYSPAAFDLRRMFDLLAALGNPQHHCPVVHIAGTKGKGSVAAMSASVLQAAGYRTGLYTSPHLLDFRERIQVDGELIAQAALAELVEALQPHVAAHPGLTHFELVTALAFMHFARSGVHVAVVEVGLGGRLDATNVVRPHVSVITSLSYDHMSLLGRTLAEIAAEKGGIIKPGVPVVTAPQPPEAMAVLEKLAEERGAPLVRVGQDWLYRPVAHSLAGQSFEIWSALEQRQLNALRAQGRDIAWRPTRLDLPLLGEHQVLNAVTACAALQALQQQGVPLSPDAVREGLGRVRWPGRFEVVHQAPYVVLDGAHNAESAARLAEAVREYFPGRRVLLIFGASSDKDLGGMLAELLRPEVGAQRVLLAQAVHPRAEDPALLASFVQQYNIETESASTVAQALARARQLATADDVILVTGSLFVVAEARAASLADVRLAS